MEGKGEIVKTRDSSCGWAGSGFRSPAAWWILPVAAAVFAAHAWVGISMLRTGRMADRTSGDVISFYRPVAENLLEGRGLVDARGRFAVRYPPGQPLYLAAVYRLADAAGIDRDAGVVYANSALAVVSVLMIWAIGSDLVAVGAGVLGAALFGLNPLFIWLSREGLSEPLFTMLTIAGCWFVVGIGRRRHARVGGTVGGLFLGAATLVRPAGLVFLPWLLLGLPLLKDSRGRRPGLWALAAFLLVLSPWVIYSSSRIGEPVLVSTGGGPSHLDGLKRFEGTPAGDLFLAGEGAVLQGEKSIGQLHAEVFRRAPASYLALWMRKAARAWYATDSGWGEGFALVSTLPLLIGGIAGAGCCRRRVGICNPCAVLGLLVLGFWVMDMLVLTIVRYMIPVLWIPALFTSALIVRSCRVPVPADPDESGESNPAEDPSVPGDPRGGLPRPLEFAIAACALLLLAPVLLLCAAAIKIGDPSAPVLFRQERVGRNGRPFVLFKLRTMRGRGETEDSGREFEPGDRDRITPVGRILRRTKFDEIPQLWNVLRGEMSLVGPRPEVPSYVALYTEEQRRCLRVRPGITDPASIRFRDEEKILASQPDPDAYYRSTILPEKLRMNLEYLQKRTAWSDLGVLIRTIRATLFPGEGPIGAVAEDPKITRVP